VTGIAAAPVHGDADRAAAQAAAPTRVPAASHRPVRPPQALRRPSELPVLRRCPCGSVTGASGECPACQAKRLAAESGTGAVPTPEAPPIVYDVLGQPGAPLDADVRAFMEPRLGQSLAATRIHTDGRAQRSAAAVAAHAYTVGRDVVFGAPGFDASDPRSLATLAHELAHTVQAGGAGWAGGPLELDSPHTESERAAGAVGRSVAAELRGAPAARVRPSEAVLGVRRQVLRQPAAEEPATATAEASGAPPAAAAAAGPAPSAASTAITGSLGLVSAGAPVPAGERLCFPPGPIMGAQWGSGFGTLAERFIEQDYCVTLGCLPGVTEYIDNNNPTAYLMFMRAHNPSLGSGAPAVALAAASVTGIARPDIMTDNGARRDYYEIKPFSPDGVAAGMAKLVEIVAFMSLLSLPYVPGTTYSPSKDIPMLSGMVLGEPLAVSLNVQRHLPGLVTYSLCLQGNLSAILAKVALAALLAWIVAQLLMMAAAAGVAALAVA
jgi:hypothetical protein